MKSLVRRTCFVFNLLCFFEETSAFTFDDSPPPVTALSPNDNGKTRNTSRNRARGDELARWRRKRKSVKSE